MNRFQKDFSKGYACAVATLIRMDGCASTEAIDLYESNFLSLKELKEIGVDEYDLEVLKPLIEEIEEIEKQFGVK